MSIHVALGTMGDSQPRYREREKYIETGAYKCRRSILTREYPAAIDLRHFLRLSFMEFLTSGNLNLRKEGDKGYRVGVRSGDFSILECLKGGLCCMYNEVSAGVCSCRSNGHQSLYCQHIYY